jgi:hypothetical protein
MIADPHPRDALYIKIGAFEAGAFGRTAIAALIIIAAVAVVAWIR